MVRNDIPKKLAWPDRRLYRAMAFVDLMDRVEAYSRTDLALEFRVDDSLAHGKGRDVMSIPPERKVNKQNLR